MAIAWIAPCRSPHRRVPRVSATVGIGAVLLLLLAAAAAAQTQTVGPTGATAFQERSPNQAVSVTFEYTATDATTTGIGIRLHFDSTKLTFNNFTGVLTPGAGQENEFFLMGPSPPETDTADKDGDAATDQVTMVAWVHTDGDFPGEVPKDLITLNFTTTGGFSGITNVRVTAIDTATGFAFAGSHATIAAPGAVTPTPTNTPTGPTPTPTVTPTPGDTATLDIDADGEVEPFSDGLLVFRYLVGFRDSNLVTGAVDLDCTRCSDGTTETAIEGYLASILAQLDIDADGEIEPFTDGLLIFRYLVGFRDANLVTGAVDTDCTRCSDGTTETAIETYLQGLVTP